MVNYEELDRIFSALADPTRRAIIRRLAHGEATVAEVASPFSMSAPAISKHLRVLETSGLITRRIEGRVHHLRLNPAPLKTAAAWMNEYRQMWESQLDSLGAYFDTMRDPEDVPDEP
jgi:DNA-binding transcriptional ArsR family regulator